MYLILILGIVLGALTPFIVGIVYLILYENKLIKEYEEK